jgi:mRNA-degrading endonuclease RelE of RelBE toxin-antitoxin system
MDANEDYYLQKGVNGVYTFMTNRLLTVAETQLFIRQAADVWNDAERNAFIDFIAANPEEGDMIPDTGGIRKIRWSRQGSGKRGGVRVIYFYHDPAMPLYLLMVYAKARQRDLSPDEKRRVQSLVTALKQSHGRR